MKSEDYETHNQPATNDPPTYQDPYTQLAGSSQELPPVQIDQQDNTTDLGPQPYPYEQMPSLQDPMQEHPFIEPQLDNSSASINSLRWWYIRRIAALLVIVGVLVGGGVGIYRSVNPGNTADLAASQTDEQKLYSGDGSDIADTKDPTREFRCPDGYMNSLEDDAVCQRTNPQTANLVKEYSCPSSYTKFNSGSDTKCQKATGDVRVVTVSASKSYVCPSGYRRSGDECSKVSTQAARVSLTCPSGYTLSGSGSSARCSRTTVSYAPVRSNCPRGYVKSGTGASAVCKRTVKPNSKGKCPRGYNKVSRTKCVRKIGANLFCPSGYTKTGSGTSTKCVDYTTAYATPSTRYYCSSGYRLSGRTCSKTIRRDASINYSCPSGYGRSGSNCIRYEGGSIASANPIVKTSCPKGYEKSTDGKKCQKEANETVDAELILTCEDGWELLEDDETGSRCVITKTDL